MGLKLSEKGDQMRVPNGALRIAAAPLIVLACITSSGVFGGLQYAHASPATFAASGPTPDFTVLSTVRTHCHRNGTSTGWVTLVRIISSSGTYVKVTGKDLTLSYRLPLRGYEPTTDSWTTGFAYSGPGHNGALRKGRQTVQYTMAVGSSRVTHRTTIPAASRKTCS